MRISMFFLISLLVACQAEPSVQPVIDIHRHAPLASDVEAEFDVGAVSTESGSHKVVLSLVSVTSPEQLEEINSMTGQEVMFGAMMPCPRHLAAPWYYCFPDTDGVPDIEWLRNKIEAGEISTLHEMMFNYDGSLPGDARMQPYWALAAEFDIPVGVHSWSGPPPGRSIRRDPNCCPDYDGSIGNPINLRPVLEQYPDLRIWLQHVGSDGDRMPELWDETLSLLGDYPNVYLDLSITNSMLPVEAYEAALIRLIDAGFGDRIMYGSDNVPLEMIIGRLNQIEIISDEQRNAILYDNAAEFLRLSKKDRRAHHAQ